MSALPTGLVVSHLGKGIAVQYGDITYLCQTRRKLDPIAVGDWVQFTIVGDNQGFIESIQPRKSLLMRPGRNGKTRPVAANIDNVYVVFAIEPHCDFLLIDQYLAICENHNIEAVLVHNKIDLPGSDTLARQISAYQAIGYRLFQVSAAQLNGLDAIRAALSDHISIFTGQSGVGKSSLTNALLPEQRLKINAVSATTRHGRHTTTAATLYHLPQGGALIDSPGVAIFGLAGLSEAQLAWGFREFQPFINQCRFHNCRHVNDKDCAVRNAAEQQLINPDRYQRFLKLREKMPPAKQSPM